MLDDISNVLNIYIITGYTDMRKSIDGLCAIIYDQMQAEPAGHSMYLFCGKCCDRIKVLLFVGSKELESLCYSMFEARGVNNLLTPRAFCYIINVQN